MDEHDVTGEGLLDLLETPAPIWLVIGGHGTSSSLVQGEGWRLVYDRGHAPTWRGAMVCRPMAGRYADANGVDVVVVNEDGTWKSETIR